MSVSSTLNLAANLRRAQPLALSVRYAPEWAEWLNRTLPNSRGVRLIDGANLFFTEGLTDVVVEEARALWASRA